MNRLLLLLLMTSLSAEHWADSLADDWLSARRRTRDERGSVTVEHVLWAVAVIAIVGIVVAAIKAYVTSQAGNIK